MAEHDLKVATEYFDAVARGDKCFEVRRDDRGFQKGDTLILRRFGKDSISGRHVYLSKSMWSCTRIEAETITATVSYILTGGQFGIEPGYVVIGLHNVKRDAAP